MFVSLFQAVVDIYQARQLQLQAGQKVAVEAELRNVHKRDVKQVLRTSIRM